MISSLGIKILMYTQNISRWTRSMYTVREYICFLNLSGIWIFSLSNQGIFWHSTVQYRWKRLRSINSGTFKVFISNYLELPSDWLSQELNGLWVPTFVFLKSYHLYIKLRRIEHCTDFKIVLSRSRWKIDFGHALKFEM